MFNNKRNIIIVALVVLVGFLVGYKYFPKTFQFYKNESSDLAGEIDLVMARQISADATYTVPGGEDKVKFVLSLNSQGRVVGVKTDDILNPDKVNPNLEKFSQELLVTIKGKKLSELSNIDKVGTSSLTTAAFNEALERLKSQI